MTPVTAMSSLPPELTEADELELLIQARRQAGSTRVRKPRR